MGAGDLACAAVSTPSALKCHLFQNRAGVMDRNSSLAALSLRPALLVLQCTAVRHSQILSFRPLRAYCEMRPHPARSELLAATPTAFHPRPLWAATLNLKAPPSPVLWSEGCRPLRA